MISRAACSIELSQVTPAIDIVFHSSAIFLTSFTLSSRIDIMRITLEELNFHARLGTHEHENGAKMDGNHFHIKHIRKSKRD